VPSFRPTCAHINLDHLAHNIQILRNPMGASSFFCPMIKANAYGHGDIEVARRLEKESVSHLGVALIEEGVRLREAGIRSDILCFSSFQARGAEALFDFKLTPVLSDWSQIHFLENEVKKRNTPINIHLKFDTGMHRMGFALTEIPKLVNYFSADGGIKLVGILTHLYSGSDAGDLQGESFEQLRRFQEVENAFRTLKPISHTLNSAGLLQFNENWAHSKLPFDISNKQGARPGLAIYGIPPLASSSMQLKPVMSLLTETIKYKKVLKDQGVSYSHTWKACRDSIVAVLPLGYADGYHRLLTNRSEVLFRGQRVPIVGNVCMDFVMIDITDAVGSQAVEALPFEKVVLLGADSKGNEISAMELAEKAETISYEILTSVSARVPRVFEGLQ
jgi:alanine racemase